MSLFTHWDQQVSTRKTNEILTELAHLFASRINSKTDRERITDHLDRGAILDLCDYDIDYQTASVADAINVRQVCAFFQKRADVDVGIDRRRAAVVKFIEAENLCFETNHILRCYRRGDFKFPLDVEAALFAAQRKIASILGDVPSLSELPVRFGPGATTQVKKRIASAKRKLSQTFACSEDLLPIVKDVLGELEGWVFSPEDPSDIAMVPVEIHRGKLAFVPKSYKTDRSIVVEPALNSMFQMGIGDYLSRRLRRTGVDIRDQSLNQRLAREGSLTGALATLDLSSASDTIATELVYELLPIDWAMFLAPFRTSEIEFEGYPLKLQKFSSMGNGFTFPLETLIFYGLAYACTEEKDRHKVSVYGDDIIVPTGAYSLLIKVLNAVGFIPNPAKSFASGPFRESCGADYLSGIDIRPVYQKTALSGFDVFRLHNFFVRRHDEEAAAILLRYISPSLRKYGPDGYGDGHLLGDNPLKPHGRDKGWSGYTFETYTFRPKRDFAILPGDGVYPSYSTYRRSFGDGTLTAFTSEELLAALHSGDFSHLGDETFVREALSHKYDRRGRLGVDIPGAKGVNLIKIYVLSA